MSGGSERRGCGACAFFDNTRYTSGYGDCRRHPPTPVVMPNTPRMVEDGHSPATIETHHPVVRAIDWCGDWMWLGNMPKGKPTA